VRSAARHRALLKTRASVLVCWASVDKATYQELRGMARSLRQSREKGGTNTTTGGPVTGRFGSALCAPGPLVVAVGWVDGGGACPKVSKTLCEVVKVATDLGHDLKIARPEYSPVLSIVSCSRCGCYRERRAALLKPCQGPTSKNRGKVPILRLGLHPQHNVFLLHRVREACRGCLRPSPELSHVTSSQDSPRRPRP